MFTKIFCLDIKWAFLNYMKTSRDYGTSVEANGQIYLLGGSESSSVNTTEYLNLSTKGWVKSFSLQNQLSDGCAVSASFDEVIVIFGYKEPNIMYKYNVTSGQRTKLADPIFKALF